ncbi:MAG: NAD-dependent epimerase/dehydratase family protein [Candidatus Nitrosocaldaceae archaeon]
MRVIVTGASGYIGSNLIKLLSREGLDVISIINRHTLDFGKVVECDLRKRGEIDKIFIDKVDAIIHLAGQVYNKNASDDDYIEYNLNITRNILDACIKYDVKKFIFASSMAVYGINAGWFESLYLPIDENHPLRPYEYYGLSKYLSEILCKFYNERYGIDTTILRYSRVYGPSSKGFINDSIRKALKGEMIVINSDISTDFVFIDDVVNSTRNALSLKGFNIFNIGSGEEVRLLELAEMIINNLQSNSQVTVIDKKRSRFYYDITNARLRLNYNPLPIKEGIKYCISHIL